MERFNKLLKHKKYLEYLRRSEAAEKERTFCHHDMEHFLAVARIAMLLNLQENLQIDKEMIYSTAILHDIGRFVQYETGQPHDIASAKLAGELLRDCDFDEEEIKMIQNAILHHRKTNKSEDIFSELLFRADKLSRNCFACAVSDACNWTDERKNKEIKI